MASSPLECILSATECSSISPCIREKLELYLNKHEESHVNLKVQYAKLQTQSEQKCFELGIQVQHFQEQSKKDDTSVKFLTDEKLRLENGMDTLQKQQKELDATIALLEKNLLDMKREKDALQLDKDDLTSLLSRRNDDLDRLTTELRSLTDQLVLSNKEKCQALIRTEELNSKQLALEYKEKRLDQERDLLLRQQQFLQDELDKRTNEVIQVRREKTNKLLELQSDLSEKIEEIRIAQKTAADLAITNEAQQAHIKELSEEMKIRAENELKISENNRHELRSQMRLCELYKASSEDAQSKADELTKATEELQRLLRDASNRYGELETQSKAEIDQLKQKQNVDQKAIEELQKELERANTLLNTTKSRVLTDESIEAMSPSAAAASRLMKSGMTLTQIFSQYVSVSEQLLFKDEENKRLNGYIDQILQEIESRAPTISRQREDYEKSLEMVASLTNQLDLATEEVDRERHNASEARRQLLQIERSQQRFQKQTNDLGMQVRFLLREVEILKGNFIPERPDSEMEVSSSDGSAAQIISRHLVTFRDIEEIQKKNQELLNVVRELSETHDEAEKNAVDARTTKIQQALENALSEIENLRETRRRHEELMENIVQQRDTYRKIVQDAGLSSNMSPKKLRLDLVTSTPANSKPESKRSTTELEKLLSETNDLLLRSEEKYATVIKERVETEKELREKLDRLGDQLAETRSQNTRVATQIQYMEEKEKLMQGNLETYKKQVETLEQKNTACACTVAKQEQTIAHLRDEALNAQQQLAQCVVTVTLLKEEKQILKEAEQRLLMEKDSLQNERHSQSLFHANLESIKLNLERSESETKTRLQNTVTSLEHQCELLRKKLDIEEQHFRETVKSFNDRIINEQTILKATEDRAVQAESSATKLQELLNAAEYRSRITSPIRKGQVTRLLSSATSAENDHTNDLRSQLIETKAELESTREQLALVRQQAQQYRSIADTMEDELKKNNEASQSFKQEIEHQISLVTNERDALKYSLQQNQHQLKELEERAEIMDREKAQKSEEVLDKISRLECELSAISEKLKLTEESELKARQECLEHVKSSQDAQEKYERELVQHAAAVELLNGARDKLEERRLEASVLEQTVARLEEELENGRSSWQMQKSVLEKQTAELTSRCAELDKQVDLMQQQIVTMSTRMAAVTRIQEISVRPQEEDGNRSLNVSIGEEETRSSDQLLELIRFLRREKENAISRFEVTESETLRLKTQMEQMQRQLADSQAALQYERERSATSALTSSKHTELLRKLETLNALTDSNRLLREERASLVSKKDELLGKLAALETEIQPLRDASRDLSNRIDELSSENQTLRKQVVTWKARTTTLQERAGRVTADDIRRLQQEKEHLQKQFDLAKDNQVKTTSVLTEFQRTNGQLLAAQQKQTDEIRKLKDEIQQLTQKNTSLQTDLTTFEAKRKEEEAKSIEKVDALRRIARKYKQQFEELMKKSESVAAPASAATAVPTSANPSTSEVTPSTEATNTEAIAQARFTELEERNAQLVAEIEQLKKEHEATSAQPVDDKTKNILKNAKIKIGNLQKEKETLSNDLEKAKTRIAELEQACEESNGRAAALRSQMEARLTRLERENSELLQAKQIVDGEMETLNQRIPVLQRQVEAYQKQLALYQQQQQLQQQSQQPATQPVKPSTSTEKSPADSNPPTANIKPMASGAVTAQRPSVAGNQNQSASGSSLLHRTTPTASIRPMAMPSRTVAVQPTTVTASVSPMVTPVAVTNPTQMIPVVVPAASASATPTISASPSAVQPDEVSIREPEAALDEPIPSTSSAADGEVARKRTRTVEIETEQSSNEQEPKRTRVDTGELEGEHVDDEEVAEDDEGDVEEVDMVEGGENNNAVTTEEDEGNRAEDAELIADEESEALMESDGEEKDEEEGEEEEEEDVIEVGDQREEVGDASNSQPEAVDNTEDIEVITTDSSVAIVAASATAASSSNDDEIVEENPYSEQPEVEEPIAPESLSAAEPVAIPVDSEDIVQPGPSTSQFLHQQERLSSVGRNVPPFEDGGDDGIVPSTPVLLGLRTNDGFAEAVIAPQVATQFIFGSAAENVQTVTTEMSTQQDVPSNLSESKEMEDTRMDLTQMDNDTRSKIPSVSSQVSSSNDAASSEEVVAIPLIPQPALVPDLTTTVSPAEVPVVIAGTSRGEQTDLEGGPDLETDDATELDLLGEDDIELREQSSEPVVAPVLDQESNITPTLVEDTSLEESTVNPVTSTSTSDTDAIDTLLVQSTAVRAQRPTLRRGTGAFTPRGRGSSRDDASRLGTGPRLVPITWTPDPNPSQPVYNPGASRGAFRRAPIGTPVMPMSGPPGLITEAGTIHSPRGTGAMARRSRGRRAGRRM